MPKRGGLFRTKRSEPTLDLDPAAVEVLQHLDEDILALIAMVEELRVTHAAALEIIRGAPCEEEDLSGPELEPVLDSATLKPVDEEDEEEVGVEPFWNGPVEHAEEVLGDLTTAPSIMGGRRLNQTVPDSDRIRDTPFTRAPRKVQVDWLQSEVLCDGGWHTAIGISRAVANDERHFRYLRSAIGGRLREMHEEGICERRDSNVRGSMFEYRLRK